MEKEQGNNQEGVEQYLELHKLPQEATDSEVAMFFMAHIDNPCTVEVAPGVIENIREFYLREAKLAMEKMTNEDAKKLLELKIKEYEP